MRKRMRPASRSVISSDDWLNETRAAFTTARSEARTASRARKPWSRTSTTSGSIEGATALTRSTLTSGPDRRALRAEAVQGPVLGSQIGHERLVLEALARGRARDLLRRLEVTLA